MQIVKSPRRTGKKMVKASKTQRKTRNADQPPVDKQAEGESAEKVVTPQNWRQRTFLIAGLSALLLAASFPPLSWGWLAWLAPLPWLLLIQQPVIGGKVFGGKQPYWCLYGVGCLFWLGLYYFLTLPHPATALGWVALSLYLAAYLPAFVGLSRVAVHKFRLPLPLAAAIIWTGLEIIRGYAFTGLSATLLGHTQVHVPLLIQVSDLFGGYGLSFLMMFFSGCLLLVCCPPALPSESTNKESTNKTNNKVDHKASGPFGWPRARWNGVVGLILISVFIVGYGYWRMNADGSNDRLSNPTAAKVAIIQGSRDTSFDGDPNNMKVTFSQYCELTRKAREQHDDLDLIVWPESMFPGADRLRWDSSQTPIPPSDLDTEEEKDARKSNDIFFLSLFAKGCANPEDEKIKMLHSEDVRLIVGSQSWRYDDGKRSDVYNSALLIDEENQIEDRYFKQHRVLFGEYIPFAEFYPDIYKLTPMGIGVTRGKEPRAFAAGGLQFAPVICFESIQPNVVTKSLVELERQGTPADVLVNVTNDGWFWGSSALDHHFNATVFRAVENRTPVIVAANTGFSGWIDGNGRVLAKGPRRATGIVYAEVTPDSRTALYQRWGDWPLASCSLFCLVCGVVGWRERRKLAKETRFDLE